MKEENLLKYESSPYLLQHANNPVHWHSWNENTLRKAKDLNKPLLVSIGYSTCHWCHVMEGESFEDQSVADIMNEYFVCVKVDREEHPDVDKYFMDVMQITNGSGGWPLNAMALPDGRAIWAGTYFPKAQWKMMLKQLADTLSSDPEKAETVASNIQKGIKSQNTLVDIKSSDIDYDALKDSVEHLSNYFDYNMGGFNRAPKFPQGTNYLFLLKYALEKKNEKLESFVLTTLDKIALGGIHDHLGGGFARYSVDANWIVPHFEKMLYDNAILMNLYSEAYKIYQKPLYKKAVYSIHKFIKNNMLTKEGAYYSAIDADSEGVEGKYYVWTWQELKSLLSDEFELFAEYYNIEEHGNWEGNNILYAKYSLEEFVGLKSMEISELIELDNKWNKILSAERIKRIPPSVDDKVIVSWNSMQSRAYLNAYRVFGDEEFLNVAKNNIEFILSNAFDDEAKLHHTVQQNKRKIEAYLEDYAFLTEALIELYQMSFDEKYIYKAKELSVYLLENFYDSESEMFLFTNSKNNSLGSASFEVDDNVIPSSNSVVAKNLFILSRIFGLSDFSEISSGMSKKMSEKILSYPLGYSNWAILKLWERDFSEYVVTGNNAQAKAREIWNKVRANSIVIASSKQSEINAFDSRFVDGKTLIYPCRNSSCDLPVEHL